MTKHIIILVLSLSIAVIATAQDERQWEILVSAVSLEQQDGLYFSGAVKGQFLNAIAVSAPVGASNYVRLVARRINWSTMANTSDAAENSAQNGFNIGIGIEHRWMPGTKLDFGVGADLSYQQTNFTGKFFDETAPNELAIDHTKKLYGFAPFLSINYHINNWLMVRIETGANIGVAQIINHTEVNISPVDVHFDATLRPVSILGLALRI